MNYCEECAITIPDGRFCNGCASIDKVGAGRYIINFLLAGIFGLLLTYLLRRRGWLATWVSLGIFIVIVVGVVIAGAEVQECYERWDGTIVCP